MGHPDEKPLEKMLNLKHNGKRVKDYWSYHRLDSENRSQISKDPRIVFQANQEITYQDILVLVGYLSTYPMSRDLDVTTPIQIHINVAIIATTAGQVINVKGMGIDDVTSSSNTSRFPAGFRNVALSEKKMKYLNSFHGSRVTFAACGSLEDNMIGVLYPRDAHVTINAWGFSDYGGWTNPPRSGTIYPGFSTQRAVDRLSLNRTSYWDMTKKAGLAFVGFGADYVMDEFQEAGKEVLKEWAWEAGKVALSMLGI